MRKLLKSWNKIPAGAAVTLDPQEQVALVDVDRLAHLEREGHLEPAPPSRAIPAEIMTGRDRHLSDAAPKMSAGKAEES